jgi:putative ABC transport system ATP-binding protein
MIQIDELRFRYRQGAFHLNVTELHVAAGATVAVIGPSGSGKTTLLNLVAGILVPDSGRVTTDGVEVSSLQESARRDFRVHQIGLVFQEFELLEHLTVLDNILLPCRIVSSISVDQRRRDRAAELAAEIGIQDKLDRYVRKLSQGERQRVALCRALLLEPPLLLCDEPTGNLDPANKAHVLEVLFDYVNRHKTTMLTVTHDHQLLDRFDKTIDFKCFQQLGDSSV